jgi:hypothetical protein
VEEVEVLDATLTAAPVPAAHVRPATLALASTLECALLVLQAVRPALTTSVDRATLDIP